MIEVGKLIPRVYTQSRDFMVFAGVMQILLNELDQKSRILEDMPKENILPKKLWEYESLKSSFRKLLKNRGSIQGLLYAVSLAGGRLISFDTEEQYLVEDLGLSEPFISRELNSEGKLISEGKEIDIHRLTYYEDRRHGIYELHINIEDLSQLDQGLLTALFYYIKPVTTRVIFEKQALIPGRRI